VAKLPRWAPLGPTPPGAHVHVHVPERPLIPVGGFYIRPAAGSQDAFVVDFDNLTRELSLRSAPSRQRIPADPAGSRWLRPACAKTSVEEW